MAIEKTTQNGLTWINMDEIDQEAIDFLDDNFEFHELDFEDLQERTQTPKIDVYQDYLFIVLQFPKMNHHSNKIVFHEIDIFVGEGFLVTLQRGKVEELIGLFEQCQENETIQNEWMGDSSGFLLYNVLEHIFHTTEPVVNKIGRQISDIEEEVFSEEQDTGTIKKLAEQKRNILFFRRIIEPQRYLVSKLSHIRKPFLAEDLAIYFDDTNDFLNKLWNIIETYKETVSELHVTVESLINQRTNKVLNALTVASVVLLPPTLLAGIYGMNIDLPFQNQPGIVWGLYGILTALILLAFYAMKKKKWL